MARPAMHWSSCVHVLAHSVHALDPWSYQMCACTCTFRTINCLFIVLNVHLLFYFRHNFFSTMFFLTMFQPCANLFNFTCRIFAESSFIRLSVLLSPANNLGTNSPTVNQFSLVSQSGFTKTANGYKFCGQNHSINPKYQHITPILLSLHWLTIEQRIKF